MVKIHWRLLLGMVAAVAAWATASLLDAPGDTRLLIGWNCGAVVYLGLAWQVFLTASEADVRAKAARIDERRSVIVALALLAVASAMTGVVVALIGVKGDPQAAEKGVVVAMSAATLVTSWTVLQTIFVAHYAHRHFQTEEAEGKGAGFIFPGQPPACYMDFVYLSFCIGATAQVSDSGIGNTRLRNLVAIHSALSFFYNTAILAVGISILAGLFGH